VPQLAGIATDAHDLGAADEQPAADPDVTAEVDEIVDD
jgi:hypothetical protein